MRVRLLVGLLTALALMGLAALLWHPVKRPAAQVADGALPVPAPVAAPRIPVPVKPLEPPAAVPPAVVSPPPLPNQAARDEAEAIALNLRHFGMRFGGNPVGTNAEIVHYLNGGNPRGVRYLPQEHLRLNEQGELVDSWGTPYFFHQISARETEIRSAGPDRKMWTPDDILAK